MAVSGGYEVTHSLIRAWNLLHISDSPLQSKVCCGADVTHAAPLKKERNQWDNNKTPLLSPAALRCANYMALIGFGSQSAALCHVWRFFKAYS